MSVSRRSLLRWSGAAGIAAAALPALAGTARAETDRPTAPTFHPIRPPATPLAVRSPYLSTWLAADLLPGTWPTFWTGRITAMAGIARIDGTPYVFMGAPGLAGGQPALLAMRQTDLTVTATRSVFTLTAAGVRLVVTFLSPVEPGDLRRQSMPLSYLSIQASSADGDPHEVSVYVDVSGEWSFGDTGAQVAWGAETDGGVRSLSITPAHPQVLAEENDTASWGTVVWSTPERAGLTWQIGQDIVVRGAAVASGALANTVDPGQPRAIGDRWPVLGLNVDLGSVRRSTAPFVVSIGHVRTPAISYLGAPLMPLWTVHWSTWQDMVSFFHSDAAAAVARSARLDRDVDAAATAAGGAEYAALCALAVRQAYGGTELVVRNGAPWAFLKEISSDGNVSTVDVTYPGMPVFLQLDPGYLGLILTPLLDYPEHGGWPKQFAEHDLGSHYPNATGHNDGNEEDMPVEESANMLIMTAAYLARAGSAAAGFATTHYRILKQWADYLVGNALDPGFQNQTDDFTGFIAHSVNLALKGIVGIGAMSLVAQAAGNSADATHYLSVARNYSGQWAQLAQDGSHLRLAYDQAGTWSLKYNAYADALLGLSLVPDSVRVAEARWYLAHRNQFGVPLDLRHSYTKTDWEMWTAAWQSNSSVRDALINDVYNFANTTSSRVPFTDWYDTIAGRQIGFQARPVIGGVFALLTVRR
ncbi:MAG TPA: DUF5127 domain-containing protein [Pseudonocardiaceae bacterium]